MPVVPYVPRGKRELPNCMDVRDLEAAEEDRQEERDREAEAQRFYPSEPTRSDADAI